MANERRTEAHNRIRAAMERLLAGEIPDGMKCDVKSLCAVSGIPRATLYRTYPHLKDEFDRRRDRLRESGSEPDRRLGQIQRLKDELNAMRRRLDQANAELAELKTFRNTALSRLAAQHDEITSLRSRGGTPADRTTVRAVRDQFTCG